MPAALRSPIAFLETLGGGRNGKKVQNIQKVVYSPGLIVRMLYSLGLPMVKGDRGIAWETG